MSPHPAGAALSQAAAARREEKRREGRGCAFDEPEASRLLFLVTDSERAFLSLSQSDVYLKYNRLCLSTWGALLFQVVITSS